MLIKVTFYQVWSAGNPPLGSLYYMYTAQPAVFPFHPDTWIQDVMQVEATVSRPKIVYGGLSLGESSARPLCLNENFWGVRRALTVLYWLQGSESLSWRHAPHIVFETVLFF